MRIMIIVGTRPEIIKMSPIVHECERLGLDFVILHTGQHYSYNMDRIFFEQLKLPDAKHNLDVGSGSHAFQTGKMMIGIEEILENDRPDVVLVEGDTNTVLAGALAAVKLGVEVGHVEAGLRSYDRTMPEEINRVLTDHCSDYLFAPTPKSQGILLGEGLPEKKIFVTGNTIVDALFRNIRLADDSKILDKLHLSPREYLLVTVHRQENVDNENSFSSILEGLKLLHRKFGFPVIYPIHPRSLNRLHRTDYEKNGVEFIDPLDYLSFLHLEKNARLILTDSGGVQEEACILRVPCVTLRDNTERPETVDVGANVIAGTRPENIVRMVELMIQKETDWMNPFGDGKTSERILEILRSKISDRGV